MTDQPSKGYYKHPNEELHRRLSETHDLVVSLCADMRDSVNPNLVRVNAELESLKGLMNKGFDPEFIEGKLTELERGLADHEIRISGLEAGFEVLNSEMSRAHARVHRVELVMAEDREVNRATARRMTRLENYVQGTFPYIGLFLATVLGVVAGWLWWRHDFSSTFMVGDQSGVAESAADWLISAILFGVGVGLAVLAFATLFDRVYSRYRMDYEAETTRAHERTSVRSEVSATSSETAPTRVVATH